MIRKYIYLITYFSLFLTGCSYNPLSTNNDLTGSPAAGALGAGIGAGSIALLHGSKPLIALGGISGGMLGYYSTTLTNDAAGITRAGGKVYKVGDYVGIYIPTDKLFEPNTANLLPQSKFILNSLAVVLKRYPKNNIIISGNTVGFYRSKWEQRLSEKRAQKVAAFLWNKGINGFEDPGINMRSLTYVGYGDYFPIAHKYTNKSLRKNARIQVTSYPSDCDLELNKKDQAFHNMGSEDMANRQPTKTCFQSVCDDD